MRHWTGSGQTAATDRRELLYRVECERPKVIKSMKSVSQTLESEHDIMVAANIKKRKLNEDVAVVKPSAPYLLGNLNTKKNIELIESKVEKRILDLQLHHADCDDFDSDLLLDIFNPEFPIFGASDSNYRMTI